MMTSGRFLPMGTLATSTQRVSLGPDEDDVAGDGADEGAGDDAGSGDDGVGGVDEASGMMWAYP